ncbi:EAL domain-containing protein [Rhodovastum atsumiense]|uniref:EAL domain-containing protein n=1 Tax=Rhodovastum atsumiense TaxID=504468 RepID=UPI00139F2CE1|nr:EAL domain-containing protein [Rhodovastum atsumiense]CAH2602704.1 EAL domain-containing protein [Rhodovastum atsumiense]
MLAAAVLGLALAVGAGAYLLHQREEVLRDGGRELRNIALVLANWVESDFNAIAFLEDSVAEWVRAEDIVTPQAFREQLGGRDVHLSLRGRIGALPRVRRLFLVDAAAQVVASSGGWPASAPSLVDRPYFQVLRDDPASQVVFSDPLRSVVDGRWNIYVARRIAAPDGTFLGIVVAALDLAYFEQAFGRLQLGGRSAVALYRQDGMLLVRHPWPEQRIGTVLGPDDPVRRMLAGVEGGTVTRTSPVDGIERLIAARRLQGYPLYLVAGRATAEVLAPSRQEAGRILLGVLALQGAIAAGVLLAARHDRHRRAMRRSRAAQAEAEARAALAEQAARAARAREHEAALDAVFASGSAGLAELEIASGQPLRANRRYCEIVGRGEAELRAGVPDEIARWLRGAAARGSRETELCLQRPDGSTAWAHLSLSVSRRDEAGRPLRCIAIVQDVTEARAATEQLRASESLLRLSMEIGHIGTFRRDLRAGLIHCGPRTRTLLGLPEGDEPVPTEAWLAVLLPEERERVRRRIEEALAQRLPDLHLHYRCHRPGDGKTRHIEVRTRYDYDADGTPLSTLGVVIDVTAAREAEDLLRLSMQAGRIGTFRHDFTTDLVECSAEARSMYGLPAGEAPLTAAQWWSAILPEDLQRLRALIDASTMTRADGENANFRIRHLENGTLRHVESRVRREYAADGTPLSALGVVIDVTTAREAEALLRLCMEAGRIGTFRHDFATGTVECSPQARALYGLPPGEEPVTEAQWWGAILPEDLQRLRAQIATSTAARAPALVANYRIRHPRDGGLRHFESRVRREYASDGRHLCTLGVVLDVTEQREAEAHIAHLAQHDALTGLPNRMLFRERLEAALARAQRGHGCAVMLVDLDRFKEVNDTLGHPVGDALLREVTARLQGVVRETDTLARLGGDEFAIIAVDVDLPESATVLARRVVESLGAPFRLDGQQVGIGASVGITVSPADGLDPDMLVKAADLALYRAKAEGRGCWRFFETEMDARMQSRRALELQLRDALATGAFEVFYQPIVEVGSRRVAAMEALLRWHHPESGLVPPAGFLKLAEETGLIVPLGEWVLRRACAEAATWPGGPRVSVNLSPAQFTHRGLSAAITAALAESGLAPERLELEITEAVMLQDPAATEATLRLLKALGVRIAMDDFGAGQSSLGCLRRFPFDRVKIDPGFIRDLGASQQDNAILRALAALCAGFEMTPTAEGVETEDQLAVLRREGCAEAQGILFSAPLPGEAVPALLRRLQQAAPDTPSV